MLTVIVDDNDECGAREPQPRTTSVAGGRGDRRHGVIMEGSREAGTVTVDLRTGDYFVEAKVPSGPIGRSQGIRVLTLDTRSVTQKHVHANPVL